MTLQFVDPRFRAVLAPFLEKLYAESNMVVVGARFVQLPLKLPLAFAELFSLRPVRGIAGSAEPRSRPFLEIVVNLWRAHAELWLRENPVTSQTTATPVRYWQTVRFAVDSCYRFLLAAGMRPFEAAELKGKTLRFSVRHHTMPHSWAVQAIGHHLREHGRVVQEIHNSLLRDGTFCAVHGTHLLALPCPCPLWSDESASAARMRVLGAVLAPQEIRDAPQWQTLETTRFAQWMRDTATRSPHPAVRCRMMECLHQCGLPVVSTAPDIDLVPAARPTAPRVDAAPAHAGVKWLFDDNGNANGNDANGNDDIDNDNDAAEKWMVWQKHDIASGSDDDVADGGIDGDMHALLESLGTFPKALADNRTDTAHTAYESCVLE
jgi:hypothetical protein